MVTALNMIIAIMSDTYSMVEADREQHSREQKFSLLADYSDMIREKCAGDRRQKDSFLVVVTPQDNEGNSKG